MDELSPGTAAEDASGRSAIDSNARVFFMIVSVFNEYAGDIQLRNILVNILIPAYFLK